VIIYCSELWWLGWPCTAQFFLYWRYQHQLAEVSCYYRHGVYGAMYGAAVTSHLNSIQQFSESDGRLCCKSTRLQHMSIAVPAMLLQSTRYELRPPLFVALRSQSLQLLLSYCRQSSVELGSRIVQFDWIGHSDRATRSWSVWTEPSVLVWNNRG
jgi:hypothetical protein